MSSEETVENATLAAPEAELEEEGSEEEGYYCTVCSALVTTGRERIAVDGSHAHTFVNQAGYIHRIGCFRRADGCIVVGEPTSEFTWFAGHRWCYAACASCHSHLGWAYFAGGQQQFFGLVFANLRRGAQ